MDLESSIIVQIQNEAEGTFDLIWNGQHDLNASCMVMVAATNDLEVAINVNPHNIMYGIVDIVEPPRTIATLNPVKDVYVDSLRPTMNFGLDQDMFIGSSGTGLFRSILAFDLHVIPLDQTIAQATLRLYGMSYGDAQEFVLGLANADWDETGTTWANQPTITSNVDSVIIEGPGYVEVDLTALAESWYMETEPNYGLILKAIDEGIAQYKRITAHEASRNKPELIVEYFDPLVWSFGRTQINSSAVVRQTTGDDLASSLTVDSDWTYGDLASIITVKLPWEMLASITVSKPEIPSVLTVRHSAYIEIDAELTVRRKDITELSGSLAASRPCMDSEIYVLYRSDIDASVAVRVVGSDDLNGSMSVSRYEMDGQILVREYNDCPSSISIRRSVDTDVDGQLNISRPDMDALILVREYNDCPSSIAVRRGTDIDMDSQLGISRPDMDGLILVREYNDLQGTISTRRSVDIDMDSQLGISRPDMDGLILVREYNDLQGTITARRSDTTELLTEYFAVRRECIDGSINVFSVSDLATSIIVRQTDKKDLTSSLAARRSAETEIECSLDVHPASNFLGSITVRQVVHEDLPCSILPMIRGISEISTDIRVRYYSFLPSSIWVRGTETADLDSSMTVELRYVSEISSSIFVNTGVLPRRWNPAKHGGIGVEHTVWPRQR